MSKTLKAKRFIEKRELTSLLVNVITVKMIFSYPRNMVITSGNASWMQMIYVSLIALFLYWLIMRFYNKANSYDILTLCQKVGGNALKIIVGIIIIMVLLFNASLFSQSLPESIKTILLPLTPMRLILLIFGIAIFVGAYMGIFSLARIHSIFVILSAFVMGIFFLLLLHNINPQNLFPILGKGTYNIFIKGLEAVSIFSDIFLLFILMPYCKNFNDAKKCGYRAIIISSLVSFLIMFLYNLVYSYPSSGEFMMSVFQMTRLIKIGDFFQRMEAFFGFIWSVSMMLYSSVYLVLICIVFKNTFDVSYYKPLIPAFAVIMCTLAFMPSSTAELLKIQRISSLITIPVCFFLPLLISFLYDKKEKRTGGEIK